MDRHGPSALRAAIVVVLAAGAMLIWPRAQRGRRHFRFALRLLLGTVLLLSSAWKLSHAPEVSAALLDQWRLALAWPALAAAAVYGLALVELAAAAGLISGRPPALVPWAALSVYGVFLVYSLLTLALGIAGECECFPWPEALGWGAAGRNLGLFAICWLLLAMRNSG